MKDKPILVITGNPPYSGHSKNKGMDHLRSTATSYVSQTKVVDGQQAARREKAQMAADDYVKFIRFAQLKMEAVHTLAAGRQRHRGAKPKSIFLVTTTCSMHPQANPSLAGLSMDVYEQTG